jgi:hypothetical protein
MHLRGERGRITNLEDENYLLNTYEEQGYLKVPKESKQGQSLLK